jgi:hypothetical protein
MHWFWRAAIAIAFGVALSFAFAGVGKYPDFHKHFLEIIELVVPRRLAWSSHADLITFNIPLYVFILLIYGLLTRYLGSKPRETRCRKCGHLLRGLSEPRCPQCGEAI